jgi:hypothetical protein
MLTRTCLAIVAVTTAILFVPAVGAAATLSVTCGPGASLQNKIDSAPSGSTILVSGKCIGNFQITGKSLTLRGNPAATLDGNYGGTTLTVEAAGKSVRLERLTVTHGKAVSGGGITKTAGNLILNRVKVKMNEAYTATPVTVAQGGGIRSVSGNVSLTNSTVSGNMARSTAGLSAFGGGIYMDSGNLSIAGSTISGNVALASSASSYARAFGGGVYTDGDVVALRRSTVNGNRAEALALTSDSFVLGGGVYAKGKLVASASTMSRNTLRATTNAPWPAIAQANGGGSDASITRMTNSTVALNKVSTKAPAAGGISHAYGGGIDGNDGLSSIVSSTVAKNAVAATGESTVAWGGGLSADSDLTLRATIIANNSAHSGADCTGGPSSAGHNLIGTAAGCGLAKKSSDRIGKAPKLGSLRWNGGPTQTMALALVSPARNAIANAACPVKQDERGVRRPQGARCDIGAFERRAG